MLSVDILGAAVVAVGIYILVRTLGTLERHVKEMSMTMVEVRVTLEEMQNHLRMIDGGIADIHSEGRAVARALVEERQPIAPN